ncbi:MAG TPA: DNA internalization-related competence protein ComEC/Rec2 [Tepidisphaeraceae bacterium]|jgi:competence protein ComEC
MSGSASAGAENQLGYGLWRRPALAAAAALLAGILFYWSLPQYPILWIGLAACCVILATVFFRRPGICSILLLGAIASAGVALAQVEAFYYPRDHIGLFATEQARLARLELRLDSPPRVLTWPYGQYRSAPPKQVVTATVTKVKTWTGWAKSDGQVLVQIAQPHPRLRQGQVIEALCTLERPGPAMNPGQFDWAGYYREQRVLASVQIPHADNIRITSEHPIGLIGRLREQTRQALALGFSANDSLDHALLCALLLGDNDPELRDIQEQFRRTGTSHHLSISGMHVAVLGGVIFGLCRLLRIGPRPSCWIALIFVLLYGVVALPSPPVIRSVVLCLSIGLGILTRRAADAVHLLAISVIAMLVYHPLDLFNAGFQLSFGTVLGLMLFTGPVMQMLPGRDIDEEIVAQLARLGRFSVMMTKLKYAAKATLAAGIVAWVVSLPLIAFHFEQLNPWAILASIILAPFVFLALVGGFAKVILTLLWPALAGTWASIAILPIAWMRHVVDWLATFPGADVPLPAPPIWMIGLYYLLLILALRVPWPNTALRWTARLVAIAGAIFLTVLPFREGLASMRAHAGDLKVTLLAIGAGQTCVIEPPGADAVLVDAGAQAMSDVLRKVLGPFLRHEGRRDIGAIFISHANIDHFSAVADAVAAYDVNDIYVVPQFRKQSIDNPPAEHLLRTLDGMDRPPKNVSVGKSFDLGGGARLEVVWPPADSPFDANNTSLVLKLTFAGRSVLFTGDIQGDAERALIRSPHQIRADVLVAPHHGSFENTTDEFVASVSPRTIVCSNDRTLSGKQRAFDREMQDRVVFRTHTSGAITIRISPAGQIEIERYLLAKSGL